MQQLKNSFLLLSMTSCSVGEAKSEMNYTARLESFAHRHTHNFYSGNVTFYIVAHSDTHNFYSGNFTSMDFLADKVHTPGNGLVNLKWEKISLYMCNTV